MALDSIYHGVIEGNVSEVTAEVTTALASDIAAEDILEEALIPAMKEVGQLFEDGEIFVPEMLLAARVMQGALNILRPLLAESGVEPAGIIAIGTVAGDLHDIGKNLVSIMLEGAGYEVRDLGTDVSPDVFVQAANDGAQVLGLSALLTTTMVSIKGVLQALEEVGARDNVKVVIGGAPITQAFADEVGADGFAPDAAKAVRLVQQILDPGI
jgi:5-methyltetrahydrofolate--homocysteine methyltransferase